MNVLYSRGHFSTMPATTWKILVVDDDPQVRSILLRKFRKLGVAAEESVDGQAALDRLSSHHYDAILLDLKMPRLDGYGFLMQRRQTSSARTPVWVLTSYPNDSTAERAHNLGADKVLSKSELTPAAVADQVARMLRGQDSSPSASA